MNDDLISRAELLKDAYKIWDANTGDFADGVDAVMRLIECAPTFARVRATKGCYCRECRHYKEHRTKRYKNLMRFCCRMGKHDMEYPVKPDDFCSYGEPKEAEKC